MCFRLNSHELSSRKLICSISAATSFFFNDANLDELSTMTWIRHIVALVPMEWKQLMIILHNTLSYHIYNTFMVLVNRLL